MRMILASGEPAGEKKLSPENSRFDFLGSFDDFVASKCKNGYNDSSDRHKNAENSVMGKALIIAEKPSVAMDIAKALGGFAKQDDYYESEQYVLSSAIGHLLELSEPAEFQVKRGK